MRMISASLSKPGGRKVNEDSCVQEIIPGGRGCWIVADGLGGHGGGDVASSIVVKSMLNTFRVNPAISTEALSAHLDAAQLALIKHQEADPRLASMRTTVVALLGDGNQAIWGHVGDSRLYLFRKGRIHTQTKDHSVPQAMADAGDIAYEDIRYHEDRNRLLRSMGNEGKLRLTVETTPRSLQLGDAFLLCTDGFWEYVTETEMGISLAKSTSPEQWLNEMEKIILKRAPSNHDNYTGIAVFVEH